MLFVENVTAFLMENATAFKINLLVLNNLICDIITKLAYQIPLITLQINNLVQRLDTKALSFRFLILKARTVIYLYLITLLCIG